ncbi:MAG: M3 family oligoendopeptidase [Anaerolineae bacterium]
MPTPLPASNLDFLGWTWSQIEPLYAALEAHPLTADTLEDWVADWGRLGKHVDEGYWRLWVAPTLNTLDEAAQTRFQTYLSTIHEPAIAAESRLKAKLLTSGLHPKGFDNPLRNMQAEVDIFSEANLPLLTEEHRLGNEYDRLRSLQTVMWEGQETALVQLEPVYRDPQRTRREQAWRLGMERCLQDRDAMNALWVDMMQVRHQLALNSGLPDYRAYKWQQLLRLDYTPQDCEMFHDSIEQVVVPAVQRILTKRRKHLKLDTVRPWDLDVEIDDLPPLHPFSGVEQLQDKAAAVMESLDPDLSAYYQTMRREGLLDLDNRPGKMPSSYCATYAVVERPFVFMNITGTHDDVMTLFHECGHAFHTFECTHLPHHEHLHIGLEFHEVAATALELLAAPHLVSTGFYSPQDAARARITHLKAFLRFWPYCAVVDAFQHWAYTHPDDMLDPARCDAQWAALWGRFMQGEDWSGLDEIMMTGWQRKLHVFRSPLYFIEYGLAQLGAVQIAQRAHENEADAITHYRKALALGGTVSLPELFTVAGAKLAFDADTLAQAVNYIEDTIAELEAQADV